MRDMPRIRRLSKATARGGARDAERAALDPVDRTQLLHPIRKAAVLVCSSHGSTGALIRHYSTLFHAQGRYHPRITGCGDFRHAYCLEVVGLTRWCARCCARAWLR